MLNYVHGNVDQQPYHFIDAATTANLELSSRHHHYVRLWSKGIVKLMKPPPYKTIAVHY